MSLAFKLEPQLEPTKSNTFSLSKTSGSSLSLQSHQSHQAAEAAKGESRRVPIWLPARSPFLQLDPEPV